MMYKTYFVEVQKDKGIYIHTHKDYELSTRDLFFNKETSILLVEYISPEGKNIFSKTICDDINDVKIELVTD